MLVEAPLVGILLGPPQPCSWPLGIRALPVTPAWPSPRLKVKLVPRHFTPSVPGNHLSLVPQSVPLHLSPGPPGHDGCPPPCTRTSQGHGARHAEVRRSVYSPVFYTCGSYTEAPREVSRKDKTSPLSARPPSRSTGRASSGSCPEPSVRRPDLVWLWSHVHVWVLLSPGAPSKPPRCRWHSRGCLGAGSLGVLSGSCCRGSLVGTAEMPQRKGL